jgi:hypothetical protein
MADNIQTAEKLLQKWHKGLKVMGKRKEKDQQNVYPMPLNFTKTLCSIRPQITPDLARTLPPFG